jgi:amidase
MTTTADADLAFRGPAALAGLVRSRQVQPRELVELSLRRIESLDPALNAFRATIAEQALAEADTVDRDGLLAGVPVAIKDDLPVAGQVATRGSKSYGPPATADSELVRRLRAAGAIPIGITNVPELLIFPWTASDANGITRNPWDVTRTPGGSSGGSAAAVASGMVPMATGSDGGGSIRIPAACCGLVGMKPTRGRVSNQPSRPGWLGLSVYGALARTVADSALVLDAIHGATDRDDDPAAYRGLAQGSRGADRQGLGRPARRLGANRRAAVRTRPRGDRARSGVRLGRARVQPALGARHLRGHA